MLDRLTIERMAAKAGDTPIIVALSGGGDSVALLHLLCEEFGAAQLRAVVVDHALREGSGQDAARAAAFVKELGVAVRVETLSWDAGANRAHEAAREARYRALCNVAKMCGARIIATGHTRDDQAETVLLRAERGSGLRGLAGMRALSPAPVWPEGRGFWLARPLLGARRETLRANLRERGAPWIEDPANANEAYARVRARRTLAKLEHADFVPMRLAAVAERLSPHVEALDAAADRFIEATAAFDDDVVTVDPAAWRAADEEVRRRALVALLAAAGAHARGPSVEQAAELDRVIAAPGFEAATLSGALLRKRRSGIELARDRGALAGRADGTPGVAPCLLPAGVETVWDGRLALTAPESGWSVVVENGAPILARAEERAPLAHASPHWLVKERVQHVLGIG